VGYEVDHPVLEGAEANLITVGSKGGSTEGYLFRKMVMKSLTPLRAIREKCLVCTCNLPKLIRECPITWCAPYPFRFGTKPNRVGKGGCGRRFQPKSPPSIDESEKIM